jgi:hypothetical protein
MLFGKHDIGFRSLFTIYVPTVSIAFVRDSRRQLKILRRMPIRTYSRRPTFETSLRSCIPDVQVLSRLCCYQKNDESNPPFRAFLYL